MISAVGIVIPARNEQHQIKACLRALRVALRQLPPDIERAVCVVADRCTDDTVALARTELVGWPAARVTETRLERSVGEARDLGVRQLCTVLDRHPPAGVWLLSTDADSAVVRDWAIQHIDLARRGAHAVAGIVELDGHPALPPVVSQRYAAVLARARKPEGHGNVYAANLGVRADAYLAVGGFGALSTGEDHDLWHRLRQAGYRMHYAEGPKVITSSRRNGRARGGLADLLRALHQDPTHSPSTPTRL